MNKLYSINHWENYPSEKSPLNKDNLMHIEKGIDDLDNRVIKMNTEKANSDDINTLVKNWSIDEKTGVITVEKFNGEKVLFDLNIEKIPVDFELSKDGILTMTTDDGSKFKANIGAMIPVLTFDDSDTITVSVNGTGVNKTYSFSIKAGSVTEDKLQPNFLADVKTEVAKAQASQTAAADSASAASVIATLAESYTHGGTGTREGEETDNAKYYMEQAKAAAGGDYVSRTEIGITVAGLVDGKIPESQLPEIGGKVEIDGTTITQNPDTKVISVAKDITDKVGEVDKLKEDLDSHKDSLVISAEGVHGLRYYDEKLEAKDSEGTWHEIETGGATTSKIVVTTPSDQFVGEDVVLSYLDGTVLQTLAFDETKVVTFEGLFPSIYIVSCMDFTKNVQVIAIGETYNIELKYFVNGDTALPINDVQIYLACAELDKSYTTIAQVLADTDALYLLMSDENAMKYLARSTGFSDSICANENAMTYLGQSAYFDTTVYDSDIWVEKICNSKYMGKVFDMINPNMTDYTSPSGEVKYGDMSKDYGEYWHYFSTFQNAQTMPQSTNAFISYTFANGVRKRLAFFTAEWFVYDVNNTGYVNSFKIQGSNDGFVDDIHDLCVYERTDSNHQLGKYSTVIKDKTPYNSYRFLYYKGYEYIERLRPKFIGRP